MDTLLRAFQIGREFDEDAQHILENSHNIAHTTSANTIALSSMPTITSLDTLGSPQNPTTTSEFLQKLGATFINSIHLQTSPLNLPAGGTVGAINGDHYNNMDFPLPPSHIVIDSNGYDTAMDELQKQVEYDKFMNEVWIGIVLTLILISMVFCFCSCFLYHQFRVWKRNYRTTLTQNNDADNVKISMDIEDPVPEYTLVSGLPSYEAALELLHKNPTSCLIVHPNVFEIFNKNEKINTENIAAAAAAATSLTAEAVEAQSPLDSTIPLLNEPPATPKTSQVFIATLPSYHEATSNVAMSLTPMLPYNHSHTNLSMANEKSQIKRTPTSTSALSSSPSFSCNEKCSSPTPLSPSQHEKTQKS